jgi:Domain of unknown function (DUF5655)/Domain of unknown function (DUF4287)
VSSPEQGVESQLRNIQRDYGHSIEHLVKIVGESGLTKHPEIVTMLKMRFGMAHGAAHRVSLTARDRLGLGAPKSPAADGAVAELQTRLLKAADALGSDVEQAPKKGYISLRRRKQFAMLQPGPRVLNVGLILPGVEARGRLEAAGKWNALFTHRVRISDPVEIDDELVGWLRRAYEGAA